MRIKFAWKSVYIDREWPMQMFAGPNEWPRTKQQQQATAAVSPSLPSLSLPAPNWSVNGRGALHPATGNRHWESLMSLWAFLIRVCICVCQMLSVEQRQRLAPQLHVQHACRPPPPYTLSCRPPPCRSLWQCNGPQWSNGRLLLSMSLRYQLRTVEFE